MRLARILQLDPRALALAVFAVALAVRVVYLLDIAGNPFFRVPVIDAEFYHQQALLWARGAPSPAAPYQMPPLYPMLLSLVYRVFGPSFWAAHLLNAVLGGGTCGVTFLLGRRLGGAGTGLVAAAFVTTSQALLYLDGDLLATSLAVFLSLAGALLLVRWVQDGGRMRDLAGAGLAFGLAAITVPLVAATVPAAAGFLAVRQRRWRAPAVFVLASLLPVVPVTLRNVRASGEFVVVSANGGINFYMGNNPDMRRTSTLRPGPEWRAMQNLPVREARLLESSQRDRWFLRRGLRFWAEDPLRALGQTFEKMLLLVHDHEIMRDFDFYYFRDHFSQILRLRSWGFAWLFGLAVMGLVWARRGQPAERLLGLLLAAQAAGIVLFFVTARYRAPLLPLLAVFAARGIVWLVERVRARDRRAWGLGLATGAAAFALSQVDFFGVGRVDVAEAEYRVASTFEKRGDLEEALRRYDAVLERDPNHGMAAARGALCTQLLGRLQEAVARYEDVLERHPEDAESAINLANLAWMNGNAAAAAHYFDIAFEADAVLPQAHLSYGLFLLQQGYAAEAVTSIEEAIELDPTWERIRIDYARALVAAGRLADARREIARSERILPPSDALELVRGEAFSAAGDTAEARAAWERGLRLNPDNAELRARLAAADSLGR